MEMKHSALKSWHLNDGKWVKTKHSLVNSRQTLEAVSLLLQRGAMKEIFDFDNYLDNTENDWTNQHLNVELLLSMN